jgi:hypothetical protein
MNDHPNPSIWPLVTGEPGPSSPTPTPRRVGAEPTNVDQGLAQLVLQLVELLRELMEKQAIRRVEAGDLSDAQLEQLGQTLMLLDRRMTELCEHFGFSRDDLTIDLGTLGGLLD